MSFHVKNPTTSSIHIISGRFHIIIVGIIGIEVECWPFGPSPLPAVEKSLHGGVAIMMWCAGTSSSVISFMSPSSVIGVSCPMQSHRSSS